MLHTSRRSRALRQGHDRITDASLCCHNRTTKARSHTAGMRPAPAALYLMRDSFAAMRRLATVLLMVIPASPVGAQAVAAKPAPRGDALVGTVVDVVGRPMPAIEVYLAGTDRSTRTDARGVWRFPNPPVGPRVVVAREVGFVPYVREVLVGSNSNDTLSLLLRRFPRTLSVVEVRARTNGATSDANMVAERLMQMRVGSGRLFTRDQILQMRPYSVAELLFGIPGMSVKRGQGEIVATSTRAGIGIMNVEGQQCQLQFYLDNTPIDNEGVAGLDPLTFRSVEVYPQTVQLTGLSMRPDRCGAIVINTTRR